MPSKEELFENAYSLTQGEYHNPRSAKMNEGNSLLIHMMRTGITNSKSSKPIIGTCSLGPCTGLGIYNKKTKTVIVEHSAVVFPDMFTELVSRARNDDSEMLEIHLIGAAFDSKNQDASQYIKDELAYLLERINETPNVRLKTFDVFKKPHPTAFAIDSRNGRLIRGTTDIKDDQQKNELDLFRDIPLLVDEDFDGTSPQNQAKRKR